MPAPSRAETVLDTLVAALAAPRREGPGAGTWRFTVRGRIAALRDALMEAPTDGDDGWLGARGGAGFAERNALLARLGDQHRLVLEEPDVDRAHDLVRHLVDDVRRHLRGESAAGPDGADSTDPSST